MLTEAQNAVRAFHQVFGLPMSEIPTGLPPDRVELRAKWMRQEIDELVAAGDMVEQVDAAVDLIYFAIGVFVEMGVSSGKIFELVHLSNLRKLDRNGMPIYDDEGRVMKPEGWVSPKEAIRQYLSDTMR